jgi:ribosomal-protein-alanine N-acetyltransferase
MDPVAQPVTDYFTGKRVDLVAMEREDIPLVARWINDERINAYNGSRFPVSLFEQTLWYEGTQKDRTRAKLIVRNKEGVPVGLGSLFKIDHRNRKAEIGVYIDPAHHRKGYAQEAMRMLMRFGFGELNLHKIYGYPLAFNEASTSMLVAVGMTREGVMQEEVWTGVLEHLCPRLRLVT